MMQPGGPAEYFTAYHTGGKRSCDRCQKYFHAETEMIAYTDNNQRKWVCIECHDEKRWD